MTRFLTLAAAAGLVLSACAKTKQSPEFERKWEASKKASQGPVVVDLRASALKGDVQRLGEATPPPEAKSDGEVPIKLTQNQVGRHIRRQLARLHVCQAAASGRSGKALVTLKIQASGRVSDVEVDAPAFDGTRLAGCLRDGALRWRFPAFQEGPISYSFPFIFR